MYGKLSLHHKDQRHRDMASGTINMVVGSIAESVGTPLDIDNMTGQRIAVISTNSSGSLPTGLGGNRFLLFSDTSNTYGVQLAIGFGSNKIAIRNAPFNASGKTWNEWRYI